MEGEQSVQTTLALTTSGGGTEYHGDTSTLKYKARRRSSTAKLVKE
jgi:hypothetical protein